jgi:hypothetical protein
MCFMTAASGRMSDSLHVLAIQLIVFATIRNLLLQGGNSFIVEFIREFHVLHCQFGNRLEVLVIGRVHKHEYG